MLEHEQHTAFLMALIHHQNPGTCLTLEGEIKRTISREKCIRRAVFAVSVVGGLAVAGIAYSAVLLPNFFESTSPPAVKLLHAIGLASAMCLAVFLPLWAQTRAHLRRLHRQCRRAIMGAIMDSGVPHPATMQKFETLLPSDTSFLSNAS